MIYKNDKLFARCEGLHFLFLPQWIVFMKKFFNSKPVTVLNERYDRLVIAICCLVWVFYSYSSHLASFLAQSSQFTIPSNASVLWIPGTLLTVFYLIFPNVLKLDSIGKILLFLFSGLITLAIHFKVAGFGIIDFAWFGFYYGSLGLLLLLRRMQRKMLLIMLKVQNNLENYDKEALKELKNEWFFLLSKFVQIYLAIAAILGVCMSILLSGTSTLIKGVTLPAWKDIDRLTNAVRMASLFIRESGIYFIFFIASLLDIIGAYQTMLIKKYEVAENSLTINYDR